MKICTLLLLLLVLPQEVPAERINEGIDTDAMTAESNALTAPKMENITSVATENSEQTNDMDSAAKMQNYTNSDPEANSAIQQADERVGELGPAQLMGYHGLNLSIRNCFAGASSEGRGGSHEIQGTSEAWLQAQDEGDKGFEVDGGEERGGEHCSKVNDQVRHRDRQG